MIALLVFTDGRLDLLAQTLASADEMLNGPITARIIVNDEPNVSDELEDIYGERYAIHKAPTRRGFAGTIGHAWAHLPGCDYVFHLEDDFTFNRRVDLDGMVTVLDTHPHLVQLALRRQPWNDAERAAGGLVELWPDLHEEHSLGEYRWLEHRLFFTTNPSLYRRSLTRHGWPLCDRSEAAFSESLFTDPALRSAFWGDRASGEAVHHIGIERRGTGY